MKNFNGSVLFLDRSDINTDEIIPARYLTENSKEALKPYLLEDLNLEEFMPARDLAGHRVIVTRDNFGCGSSREHAPWALEVNGFNLVIAEGFARIFRQNMYNCGMMAVTLPSEQIEDLFTTFDGHRARVETDLASCTFHFSSDSKQRKVVFTLSDYDRSLVEAGGWVELADSNY
jgi:3-isopropylmalate/(R)-2-methylmalate dehydratase small subunit